MNIKYPKNVIVTFSVIAALLGATVLLGGYANSKPVATESPATHGCCPAMGQMSGCPQMMAAQTESTGCSKTPCTEVCPKPCCEKEGCCDDPCPIPCPKPCCAEGGCCVKAEAKGCCAAEADVE